MGLNKHAGSSSTHRAVCYHVSLDHVNLPHISNRPQQTPLLNGWEKSHITRCALVLACRTSFLPNQSIIFYSSSSAQDSLQVSVTAADTVTGSAIKHTALGCIVRVSQGTKMLFSLLANSRKALAVTACLPGHVWPQGLQGEPQNPKQVKSVVTFTARLHPGGFYQSPSLCLSSAEHSAMFFLILLGLFSSPELLQCLGWRGKHSVTNTWAASTDTSIQIPVRTWMK